MSDTLRQALIAAVLANPDDDAPRLIIADYLDDHAETVDTPCPTCGPYHADTANPFGVGPGYHPERSPASGRHEGGWTNCQTCRGRGTVRSSNGFAEYAEFIRIQIALACWPCECDSEERVYYEAECRCNEKFILQRRERALWNNLYRQFDLPGVIPGTPYLDYNPNVTGDTTLIVRVSTYKIHYHVARGFIEAVTCSANTWIAKGDAILRQHPVRVVTVATSDPIDVSRWPTVRFKWQT